MELVDNDPYVCMSCIGDPVLRSIITMRYRRKCAACDHLRDEGAVSAFVLARTSDRVIRAHFENVHDTDGDYERALSLAELLAQITAIKDKGLCESMAIHVRINCNDPDRAFYSPGVRYSKKKRRPNDNESERDYVAARWDARATQFKHSRRYFNDNARKFFALLFDVAITAKSLSLFKSTPAVIKTLRAGTGLFRGRLVSDADQRERIKANPAKELAAPPKSFTKQNRMNAAGVPMFYGARDRTTCIAEVRPSIGDEIAIARFQTTRDLRFFDFTNLDNPLERQKLSVWLDDYQEREEHLTLLKYLHRLIAQPVRTTDSDYIMTQAMAEFLRFDAGDGFEGIIFGSVQAEGGVNYVIFSERDSLEDVGDPSWEPRFPIALHPATQKNGPEIHRVSGVKYQGTWKDDIPPRAIDQSAS